MRVSLEFTLTMNYTKGGFTGMAKDAKNRMEIQAERKAQKLERKAAEKKAKKKTSVKNTIIIVCVILMFALAVALFAYEQIITSGIIERNTTVMSSENYKISESMMTYFFNSTYQNFANQYSSYLSSFGLDTTKSLKEQTSMDGSSTWYDYFMSSAKSQAQQILVLCEAANANGVTLDDESYEEIDETIETYKSAATQYGYDANTYIKLIFGTSVNLKDMRKCLELSELATQYATVVSESYEYTDEDYTTYFNENKDTYTYVDYAKYTFAAAADSDGNYLADDIAAMKAKGEALAATTSLDSFKAYVKDYLVDKETAELEDGEELDETSIDSTVEGLLTTKVTKSSAGEEVAAWAFDAETKVGDTYIDSDDEKGSYTVYILNATSYIEDYTTKNGAYIYLTNSTYTDEAGASAKADEIITEWNSGDKTAESFLELTEKYSESGHLHDIVKNIDKDEPYSEVLYSEDAVVGGVSKYISTEESGVFIVYYAGDSELTAWEAEVDTALRNADYSTDYDEMAETYAVEINEDKINTVIPVTLSSSSN